MPPVRVTRPVSGVSAPVIRRSSVDLPPPLRPTTPMRSPSLTPIDRSRSTVVVPYDLLTASRLTRLR